MTANTPDGPERLMAEVLIALEEGRTPEQIRACVERAITINDDVDEELKATVIQFPQPHRPPA